MIELSGIRKSYKSGHKRREVLKGVDLRVNKGDRIGLMGRNGAGKSTLIKLIGGVEMPDSGQITRTMTTSWPIGFGGGFQGSLTGYDNARFIARIYGADYKDIRDFVADFTELGGALAREVKTYSSGMRARLAFALSLAIEFDCYLIDEVIMVGDQRFHARCAEELFHKRADRAMIIVSHDMTAIQDYCSSAAVLEAGTVTTFTGIDEAIEVYQAL